MRHEDIAIALAINVDTLRKYYEQELSVGAAQRRLEALEGIHRAAKRGSSSAAKVYLATEPQIAVPADDEGSHAEKSPATAAEVKETKLGKKDQANADAATAAEGTGWKDLLPGSTVTH